MSQVIEKKYTHVVTLGPEGTDASTVANLVSEKVIYRNSFPDCMEYALEHDYLALICVGYVERKGEVVVDNWVDLNFRYHKKMELIEVFKSETKPMALAKRRNCHECNTIVIHPATKEFASQLVPQAKVSYVNNKPLAVELVAEGHFDYCIGSQDVVQQYDSLEITKIIPPPVMIWAVYQKVGSTVKKFIFNKYESEVTL
ncbi:hypothetical protein [Paenibacillus sp. A3]|uniref:hypothetical protein n=1 Tax=Paenibacillus sp. A3 TaxID=1337054 RepID=UPI0006D59A4F|nr:hypothetical protein [Paenibacillus sp. A3]